MTSVATQEKDRYRFISNYLRLLLLPVVIGLGAVYIQSLLMYDDAMEEKLVELNHAVALSEVEELERVELALGVTISSRHLMPITRSQDSQYYYRKIWSEQMSFNPLLLLLYAVDAQGQMISSNPLQDQYFSSRLNPEFAMDPRKRSWYLGALAAKGELHWEPPYLDMSSRQPIMTVTRAQFSADGSREPLVYAVDLDLSQWSRKIANVLYGNNAIHHLLVDRRNGEILLHSNASKIGERAPPELMARLLGPSGSFFSEENGESVAYEALSQHPNWVSVLVQVKRDIFSAQQSSMALVIAAFTLCLFLVMARLFRLNVRWVIDILTQIVQTLRLASEQERKEMVMPHIPFLSNLNDELQLVSKQMRETFDMANRDGLTGLYNRRYLDNKLAKLQLEGQPFVLALIDLDNFKSINDTHGHKVGDVVLCRVAELGQERLGDRAILCRFGGEELAAIFVKQDSLADARQLMDAWRIDVANEQWQEKNLTVTFSGGVGMNTGQSTETLLREVDQALYRSKQAGKNQLQFI